LGVHLSSHYSLKYANPNLNASPNIIHNSTALPITLTLQANCRVAVTIVSAKNKRKTTFITYPAPVRGQSAAGTATECPTLEHSLVPHNSHHSHSRPLLPSFASSPVPRASSELEEELHFRLLQRFQAQAAVHISSVGKRDIRTPEAGSEGARLPIVGWCSPRPSEEPAAATVLLARPKA